MDFPVQRVETTAADAQLVPTARVMRKALAQKHTGSDRGREYRTLGSRNPYYKSSLTQ